MAHKSDFFTSKLPRSLKKMLAMGEARGYFSKAEARQHRLGFIDAHANHLAFKLKRVEKDSSGE